MESRPYELRLRGLDLSGQAQRFAVCLATAASLFGFDTEQPQDLHVLNPPRHQMRPVDGLRCSPSRWRAPRHGRRATERRRPPTTVQSARSSAQTPRFGDARRGAAQHHMQQRRALARRDPAGGSPRHRRSARTLDARRSAGRVADGERGTAGDDRRWIALPGTSIRDRRRQSRFASSRLRLAGSIALAVEYDGVDWHSDPEALRKDRLPTGGPPRHRLDGLSRSCSTTSAIGLGNSLPGLTSILRRCSRRVSVLEALPMQYTACRGADT